MDSNLPEIRDTAIDGIWFLLH